MQAWNVTEAQVLQAAKETGIRVDGLRPAGKTGRSVYFTLKTSGPTSDGNTVKYGRRSMNILNKDGAGRRIPGAVCWHGHRDFMRTLFGLAPSMRIKSALADYRGAQDFETRHESTYGHGNGYHLSYGQACDC